MLQSGDHHEDQSLDDNKSEFLIAGRGHNNHNAVKFP